MFQRDYVMRQVTQLVNVLARVLLLREAGRSVAAAELLAEAVTRELGIEMDALRGLSRRRLLALCSNGHGISPEKATALADLLAEDAVLLETLGRPSDAEHSRTRASWLYEEAQRAGGPVPFVMRNDEDGEREE